MLFGVFQLGHIGTLLFACENPGREQPRLTRKRRNGKSVQRKLILFIPAQPGTAAPSPMTSPHATRSSKARAYNVVAPKPSYFMISSWLSKIDVSDLQKEQVDYGV